MLISAKQLKRCRVAAQDKDLGSVEDVFIDDHQWSARFFIVSTARLLGRDVLIAPYAVSAIDPVEDRVSLSLSSAEVEDSPPLDFAKPVSRQKAEEYYAYYGWPYFWGPTATWGFGMLRYHGAPPPAAPARRARQEPGNPNLRSFGEIAGYGIQGTDDDIGHLEDVLFDSEHWIVRYLVVDTRNWLPGKQVLLLPESVASIDWHHRQVHVDLPRARIEQAPRWEPRQPLTEADERRIHAHYGLSPYWERQAGGSWAPSPG